MRRTLVVALVVVAAGIVTTWRLGVWPFGPLHVQICRSDGRPILGAVLVLHRPGEPSSDYSDKTHSGDGWLSVPRGSIRDGAEMFLTAPGCGLLRSEPRGGRILLPEGLRVTLRVDGDFELPRPPRGLGLRLEPVDGPFMLKLALSNAVVPDDGWQGEDWERDASIFVDPDTRSVDVLVPRAGMWEVHWAAGVREVTDGGATWSGSGPSQGIVVEIPGGGGAVPVEIWGGEFVRFAPR